MVNGIEDWRTNEGTEKEEKAEKNKDEIGRNGKVNGRRSGKGNSDISSLVWSKGYCVTETDVKRKELCVWREMICCWVYSPAERLNC